MTTPYLGEIRGFSFNFAPKGWALCNGQTLPINQNQALFALLGTTYGGNGQTTFVLPNLQGRSPIHFGGSEAYQLGENVGLEAVTLTEADMAAHSHQAFAAPGAANQVTPADNLWANSDHTGWSSAAPDSPMDPSTISLAGGGQPHENRSPFLTITYCIALVGVFPSQN
jgi:microcystin-dependent protein